VAGTVDWAVHVTVRVTVRVALEVGYPVAGRVLRDRAASHEAGASLPEQVRTALREVVYERLDMPTPPPRHEITPPRTKREFLEVLPGAIMEALGRGDYWTPEKAMSKLAPGLSLTVFPMIWTGGQTPGQALLGVRVVSLDGRRITARQALEREFGFTVLDASFELWPVPETARAAARLTLLAAALTARLINSDRRSLNDLVAGTRVIREA
jgi:uncharacterized RDD family membrane protein YckC